MKDNVRPVNGGRGDRPGWKRRLLVLVVLVAAAGFILAIPICQVYHGT
jgi:hypothetical protein